MYVCYDYIYWFSSIHSHKFSKKNWLIHSCIWNSNESRNAKMALDTNVRSTKTIAQRIWIRIFCHTMIIACVSRQPVRIGWAMWMRRTSRPRWAVSSASTLWLNRRKTHSHWTYSCNVYGTLTSILSYSYRTNWTTYHQRARNALIMANTKCGKSSRRTPAIVLPANYVSIIRRVDGIVRCGICDTPIGRIKIVRRRSSTSWVS